MQLNNSAIPHASKSMMTGGHRLPVKACLLLLSIMLLAAGCSTRAFIPPSESATAFTERAITQSQGAVTVSAAVPSAEEVKALLGVDLYRNDIQPVWLRAENNSDKQVRVALWSLDPEYFSPMEVAWNYRRQFGSEGRRDLERWLYENQMPRRIAPGKSLSGFVFTHRADGTKGFNVDLYGADRSYNFTFFVPLPGFRPDFMDVSFKTLYQPDAIRDVDLDGLGDLMESFDCCSTDASGELQGDPINIVLVGTPLAVRRALLRGAWQETRKDDPETAVARTNYFDGRPPDGVFLKSRPDGDERKQLRLWMAPIRVDGQPLWLGQISYNMSGVSWLFARDQYKIDPDIDDARMFLVQNFWYSQSLSGRGFVAGVPAASIDSPVANFEGHEYFTDGLRSVLVLSESPIGLDETELFDWGLEEKFGVGQ
jgi:hypothetical protein